MSVVEVRIEVDPAGVDAADNRLLEGGCVNWSIVEDVKLKRAWLVGVFPDEPSAQHAWREIEPQLTGVGVAFRGRPACEIIPDANWRDSYKAHFKAWHFGRLHWVPIWEKDEFRLPEGEAVLWLDPGLAFGTGNHETTRLCVERLVALASESCVSPPGGGAPGGGGADGRPVGSELRVVDAGCGSGILALSAALLGFSHVTGFDNDPEAIRVSQENAAINGLSGRVRFFAGDLGSSLAERQADILLANIQADVLMRFARQLVRGVAPGGTLVMSGILAEENAQVREVFEALTPGWAINARTMGEWSDVMLAQPKSR